MSIQDAVKWADIVQILIPDEIQAKVYEEEMSKAKIETLEKIELNMVVKGKVVRLTEFGAFVDIGGIDGLLPLSQISWKWIDNPWPWERMV